MSSLKKKQAEIRFSCFLIIDELFNRSHTFREHLLDSFKLFVQLTVGMDLYSKHVVVYVIICVMAWHNFVLVCLQ